MFVPGKPFQPSLMFVDKARALHATSLLRKSVNYGREMFYSTDPCTRRYETFTAVQNKLECLSLAKHIRPNVMFSSKAGAYPREAPLRFSTLG